MAEWYQPPQVILSTNPKRNAQQTRRARDWVNSRHRRETARSINKPAQKRPFWIRKRVARPSRDTPSVLLRRETAGFKRSTKAMVTRNAEAVSGMAFGAKKIAGAVTA